MTARAAAAIGLVGTFALAASPRADAQPSSGPMTIERLHSGPLVGGDVKITDVDHHTSALIGGQAGWIVDDTISIGGGGYWLANGGHDRGMAYGGLIVQWFAHSGDRFGVIGKGLVGGGEARLADTFTTLAPVRISRSAPIATQPRTATFLFDRGFFVAEPEANVYFRVAQGIRLTGGVGYRFIGAEGSDDDRLRGLTGSVGVQIF